ncbi:MAG: DUF4430 domain-containing protein [Clostridia bacterium]|nr:DUF4430 domain-containing protein [Clostridia bacterium]
MKNIKKIISLLLCVLCIFFAFSCAKDEKETPKVSETTEFTATSESASLPEIWKDAIYKEDKSFGEGAKKIEVEVKAEEKSVTFTIFTEKENLAEILLEHKLVEGEDGAYGLYIKKVNGILADYDMDQSYWSFEKSGEMQMVGVSDTSVLGGEHFELVYTK